MGVALQTFGHYPGGGIFVAHPHPFHSNCFAYGSSQQLPQFFEKDAAIISISTVDDSFGNLQRDGAFEFHRSFRVVVQRRQSHAGNRSHEFVVQRFVDLLRRH